MADEDPASDTDQGDTPTHCGTCGTRLDAGSWHPTVGQTDPDGTYRILRFCSDECRRRWDTTRNDHEVS